MKLLGWLARSWVRYWGRYIYSRGTGDCVVRSESLSHLRWVIGILEELATGSLEGTGREAVNARLSQLSYTIREVNK